MKKVYMALLTLVLIVGLSAFTVHAAAPVDADGDGYKSNKDCNDDPADPNAFYINPGATEICDDGLDNDCDGDTDAADSDCASTCTENDTRTCDTGQQGICQAGTETCIGGAWGSCVQDNAAVTEGPFGDATCSDSDDNDCDGATDSADSDCQAGGDPHANLTYTNYPDNCMGCHDNGSATKGPNAFNEMFASVHYQWKGPAPDMIGGPNDQGKIYDAMNTYCINILGNWKVCGKCHAGRGVKPGTGDTKANIDCLICHNEAYAAKRTRLPDGTMGPAVDPKAVPIVAETDPAILNSFVSNPQAPTTKNCLKCHAYGGGANGVKRGDLAWEITTNTDPNYDVHMNIASTDKQCIECHSLEGNHKISGRGSDLRPTDSTVPAICTNCHTGMDSGTGHEDAGANRTDADRHVARVSCQACHISIYGKSPTETHRIWRQHHDGTPGDAEDCGVDGNPVCPGHPDRIDESNLTPTYAFWNGQNDNYLLGEAAVYDAAKDTYQTSVPVGDVNADDALVGGKLYPFKYKTSEAPISAGNKIIAVDTLEYLKVSGNINTAIDKGIANMQAEGITVTLPWTWGTSDTYQLITHGVEPAATVSCDQCHESDFEADTTNKLDALGYSLIDADGQGGITDADRVLICQQCHRAKAFKKDTEQMHAHLNKGRSGTDTTMGCAWCHDFRRPERNTPTHPVCDPCDDTCNSAWETNIPWTGHVCP